MKNKSLIVFILLNFFILIQSCCTTDYVYQWKGLEISLIDDSVNSPSITQDLIFSKKNFGIRVKLKDTLLYAINLSSANQAFATSCAKNYTKKHNLSNIRINTLNDYSSKYPAGADITSLFKARNSNEEKNKLVELNNIIAEINNNSIEYQNRIKFDLCLIDTISLNSEQNFDIILKFSDGDSLNHITNMFRLK